MFGGGRAPLQSAALLLLLFLFPLHCSSVDPGFEGWDNWDPLDIFWLPRFHIRPDSANGEAQGMNDPCGPMVFNGMYHTFFQDWLPKGTGWGHVVSADLAHFAHLPPALRVDEPFDGMSINTGSVTIVNGTPYAVYNGGNLRNGTVLGQ